MVNHSKLEKVIKALSFPVGFMIAGHLAVSPTESIMLRAYYGFVNIVRYVRRFL